MAALGSHEGAHSENAPASILEASADGLDNKDRWHWKERDLRAWVNDWLMAAFVQFDGGLLVDAPDAVLRCKLVRADYEASGGDAFLTWRKGAGVAHYSFGVRAEVQGVARVGGRVLGQAKGVAWFHDVKYDDDADADANRPFAQLQGAWEVPDVGQQHQPDGPPGQRFRPPAPYEAALKDACAGRGLDALRAKVACLRAALAALPRDSGLVSSHGAKLPDPSTHALRAMEAAAAAARAAAAATEPPALQGLSAAAAAAAKASAAAYVAGLRKQHRSAKLVAALAGDPEASEVLANLCDLRAGADVDDLVAALQASVGARLVDLRDNPALDDGALQPILLALATGACPLLTKLRLGGTSASVVSRNMASGLALMRKGLVVEFGGSALAAPAP